MEEEDVCVVCGEGPYIEPEWNLKLYTGCASGCCTKEWFHPECFNKEGVCPKERYEGPMCIFCGEGPYLEEVWHLQKIGCCDLAVYHPACTVELLKEVYGILYWDVIRCPYCELDPAIEKLLYSCSIM